jgi:hypothetical protein
MTACSEITPVRPPVPVEVASFLVAVPEHLQNMDRRTCRRAETGEEAHLTAGPVGGPGGAPWWSVTVLRADGSGLPLGGIAPVQWWPTREEAREGYRERLRALRGAGFAGVR